MVEDHWTWNQNIRFCIPILPAIYTRAQSLKPFESDHLDFIQHLFPECSSLSLPEQRSSIIHILSILRHWFSPLFKASEIGIHLIGCHDLFGSNLSFLVACKIMAHPQWCPKFKEIQCVCEMNWWRWAWKEWDVPSASCSASLHCPQFSSKLLLFKDVRFSSESEKWLAEDLGAS